MVRFEKLIKTTAFTRSWSNLEIIYISPCCMHTTKKLFSYPSGSAVSMDSTLYKYQRKHLFQNVLARKQSADQCLYTYAHIWDAVSHAWNMALPGRVNIKLHVDLHWARWPAPMYKYCKCIDLFRSAFEHHISSTHSSFHSYGSFCIV